MMYEPWHDQLDGVPFLSDQANIAETRPLGVLGLIGVREQFNQIASISCASLQITFSYKPVICQARDKVWPDMQPVWSDKKRRENNIYQRTL